MKYRHRVLAMLFLLSILTFLDRICISVAGPRIQSELQIPPHLWGWVVGIFSFSYGLFEIPTGALGDRIGPRKVLPRIVLWWSAFTTLTGGVSSYSWLLVVRFLFGAGEAGAYPNSSTTIARWFPAVERARAQGMVWMASRLGGALTPLLVIPIQLRYGWRASFYIFGVVGVVWAAVWYWWYRDPEEKAPKSSAHHSLPWNRALRSPNFWMIIVMYHTYCYGGYFYQSWLHTYLVRGRGFTDTDLAFFSTLPFLLGAAANGIGGFASDALVRRLGLKWGRRTIGLVGLSASALFTVVPVFTRGRVTAVLFLALGFAASDFMLPTCWAVCVDIGKQYAGAISASMNTAGQAGSFISSILFGYLVQAWGSYDLPLIPIAVMLTIAALLWLRIDPTRELSVAPVAAAPSPAFR